ncbi:MULTISPECIES: MarR family winged helix-turn-helix transcriptional regulator [Microbacterium]|jgi:DNA-binding MarR family transcriptional regulator|uniref:MarR family transcriptional regulator n=1 Tax=Microbacterium schleiferi TaxID=69362 RepID=A0ABU7V797_9MICO|nr:MULTISPECIES: MarR family transcriptional regulator [unclassified Microbacterium]MBD3751315.1 MarR family transcriptional regulator [Micrococcales bacterium]
MSEPAAPEDLDPAAREHRAAVDRLEGAISELISRIRKFYAQIADEVSPGMLPGTFKLLATIGRIGPTTSSTLAHRLTADKGMISRQISELESLGFIERTADPDDRRSRLISLTAEGRKRLDAARAPYERMLSHTLAEWPTESIDDLTDLLTAFASGDIPKR